MTEKVVLGRIFEAVAKLRRENIPPLACGLYKAILHPVDAARLLWEIGSAVVFVTQPDRCPEDALGPGETFVCALAGVLVVERSAR